MSHSLQNSAQPSSETAPATDWAEEPVSLGARIGIVLFIATVLLIVMVDLGKVFAALFVR